MKRIFSLFILSCSFFLAQAQYMVLTQRNQAVKPDTVCLSKNDNIVLEPRNDSDFAQISFMFGNSGWGTGYPESTIVTVKLMDVVILRQNNYLVSCNDEELEVELENNYDYSIKTSEGWIKEVSTNGKAEKKHRFAISANNSNSERTAEIIFYNTEFESEVKALVKQMGKESIVVANDEYQISSENNTLKLPLNNKTDYNVDISVDWIKLETGTRADNDALCFVIEKNNLPMEREGEIIIKGQNSTQTIKINQKPYYLLDIPDHDPKIYIGSDYSGGLYGFDVYSNGEYSIEFIGDDTSFIHYKGREDKGNNLYTDLFFLDENNESYGKKFIVKFSLGDKDLIYHWEQCCKREVELSQSEFYFSTEGGTAEVELTKLWQSNSSGDMRIQLPEDAQSWLTLKEEWANEKGSKYSLTAKPNLTPNVRTAKLFVDIFIGEKYYITVTQLGQAQLVLTQSEYILGATGGEFVVDLSESDYELEISGDWVSAGEKWQEGLITKQKILFAKNADSNSRKGSVTFKKGDTKNMISLTQLEPAPELIDDTPERWKKFEIPEVTFVDNDPTSLGSMIYNAIVPDIKELIGITVRKVLDALYYTPEDEFIPRRKSITYILEDFDGVSYNASGGAYTKIALSTRYLAWYYNQHGGKAMINENIGVLAHELTHSYQLEPQGVGDYGDKIFHACIEGTADALRYLVGGFTEADAYPGGSYLDSYRFTGFFLGWLTKKKDKDFLRKFNLSTQHIVPWSFDGAIKYALGEEYDIDELWREYQQDFFKLTKAEVKSMRFQSPSRDADVVKVIGQDGEETQVVMVKSLMNTESSCNSTK